MKKAQWITKDNDEANNQAEQVHRPALRALSKIMRNFARKEGRKATEKKKHEGWKRVAQEPPELGARHQTAPSCPTQARIGCSNIRQNTKCKLNANDGSPCETTIDPSRTHNFHNTGSRPANLQKFHNTTQGQCFQ